MQPKTKHSTGADKAGIDDSDVEGTDDSDIKVLGWRFEIDVRIWHWVDTDIH